MDTITFLEQLAKNVHHSKMLDALINQQQDGIKKALLMNAGETIKRQLNKTAPLADLAAVTQA